MENYQLSNTGNIIRLSDGAIIPPVSSNKDYAAYQIWLAVPNTPLPATD